MYQHRHTDAHFYDAAHRRREQHDPRQHYRLDERDNDDRYDDSGGGGGGGGGTGSGGGGGGTGSSGGRLGSRRVGARDFHGSIAADPVLQAFKSNNSGRSWALQDIRGSVVTFARDVDGSRFIRDLMYGANDDERNMVFAEAFTCALDLMTDQTGNYVIQYLLEHCAESQRASFMDMIVHNISRLSEDVHGCRVVQRAIDVASPQTRAQLAQGIEQNVGWFSRHQYASRVVASLKKYGYARGGGNDGRIRGTDFGGRAHTSSQGGNFKQNMFHSR